MTVSLRRMLVAALALSSFGAPALAHEGGADARGAVVEVSSTRIVLRTPRGDTRSFAVTARTEIRRGNVSVKLSEVRAGEKAVVHAKSTQGGEPEATAIRLAKDAAPPK